MTAPHLTQALCICDGARVPAGSPAAWTNCFHITTMGEDAEITFIVENLVARLGDRIALRVQDLLAIAAYCSAVDREVRRTAPVDVNRGRWRCDLAVCLPVVDLAFWSTPAVIKALSETLNSGTDDRWTFHFD